MPFLAGAAVGAVVVWWVGDTADKLGDGLLKLAVVAGAGYAAYRWIK